MYCESLNPGVFWYERLTWLTTASVSISTKLYHSIAFEKRLFIVDMFSWVGLNN